MVAEARGAAGAGPFLEWPIWPSPSPCDPGDVRRDHLLAWSFTTCADWEVALGSFATVLRPGGLAGDLARPSFRSPHAGQQGGYFDTELVSDTWTKDGVEGTQHFWRRPLSAAVDDFAEAGFAVERLVEVQPSAEALQRFPDELGAVVGAPWFIVYRLRLTCYRLTG